MKAVKIKEGIYWVGAIDWDLRNFHGYLTQKGSTYNAYLIIDEKITLIDSVKSTVKKQLIDRIKDIIDPAKIDVIISNHVEMDHSGSIADILELAPNAVVYTSPNGEKGLKAHYKKDWNFIPVKTGDVINLGKRTLQVVNTPMVHWPDNMVCYMPEEKILFSNDSFGQHYASQERFDDETKLEIVLEEAKKYYANIVMPFNRQVEKEYNDVKDFDIEMIAPSHGIIWRKHVKEIIAAYLSWVTNTTKRKAVIVYDTMWKSTEKLAYEVVNNAFEEKGIATQLFNLQANHISDIITEVLDAEYICVGSPTLNNNLLPTVAGFLTYLKGLSPGGRKAIAFGSYGWGGQSIAQVEEYLKESKFDLIDSIKVKYIPDEEELLKLKEELKNKLV
jgi:flavorubredoxin